MGGMAVIARNLIAFAGLSNRIEICIGHSELVLPHLAARWTDMPTKSRVFGAIFMDQSGARYSEDLAALENLGFLQPGAIVVADNVLKPGAPAFLWHVIARTGGSFAGRVVSVREFAMPVEDWMAICEYQPTNGHGWETSSL